MAAGSECFQVLRLQKTHSDFHLLQLSGRAIFVLFSFSRTPAELSLGIFNTVHNRCWSSENTPGTASASLLKPNRWCLLVGRGFMLCFRRYHRPAVVLATLRYLLCLLGVSPPAIRHFPLAPIVLLGWVIDSFQWVTPTCDEHNACLNGAFSPLFWCCTCVQRW